MTSFYYFHSLVLVVVLEFYLELFSNIFGERVRLLLSLYAGPLLLESLIRIGHQRARAQWETGGVVGASN